MIFSHLALAVTGLCVWVAYIVLDKVTLAWAAFGLLAIVTLLGITMFARWIPVYREPAPPADSPRLAGEPFDIPAEGNFPLAVVAAHGLLASTTLILVFLAALGVGGS